MFLVGMCDLFLLLYLTAQAQLDERPKSRLTVGDYKVLERTRDELLKKEDQLKLELEKRNKELEEKLKNIVSLESKTAVFQGLIEKSQKEQSTSLNEIEEVKKKLLEAEELVRKFKETSLREKRLADIALKEAQSLTESEAKEKEELMKALQEAKKFSEKQKQELEEANKKAQEASQEAAKAKEEAEHSARFAAESEEARQKAEGEASRARTWAAKSSQLKDEAEAKANEALSEANQATKKSLAAEQRVEQINQSAKRAYEKNIKPSSVLVEISVKAKGLFGSVVEKTSLKSIPVSMNDEQIVFVLVSQTALEEIDDASDLESLSFTVLGKTVNKIYVSKQSPYILGLVIPEKPFLASMVSSSKDYMPVLIALRSGAPMRFGDRVRDLSENYFVFQRDRLHSLKNNRLGYSVSGFRGTGDYAERILSGDQIVDLDAGYIGIAVGENVIQTVENISNWKAFELAEKKQLMKLLLEKKR